jgi:hypothetical protein
MLSCSTTSVASSASPRPLLFVLVMRLGESSVMLVQNTGGSGCVPVFVVCILVCVARYVRHRMCTAHSVPLPFQCGKGLLFVAETFHTMKDNLL